MSLGGFSIKKKYILLAVTIAIVLAGLYAMFTINTQLAPDTNPPMATVIARYPGATAQDVVLDVVEPMEKEFMMLDGVQQIKSTSQDNSAVIQVEFSYATNIDEAAVDLQNTISGIRDQLPDQMQEPRIMKFSASDKPILTVSLSSDSLSMQDIRQLAEDRIAYELQLVDGVAAVEVFGGYRNEVQVQVDREAMTAYSLTLQQIAEAIGQSNVKAPGGKVEINEKEVMIRVQEGYESLDDLRQLTLNLPEGQRVYLSDIAEISLSVEALESSYRFNGEESIALMITKQGSANTIQVVETLHQRVAALEAAYPVLDFSIAQDDSVFTQQMVNNMTSSVLLAILMTVVVIILFIGNIGQSLAVSISMPLVFLSTLMLMKFTGMELDMVTLSALILSIGFVVDGAVVVVENIMSHRIDQGKNMISAAIDGTNEIALPTIAGASTTLVVLIPLLFIQGFVGEMFRPLSKTLIYAIASSVVIALTIIPLLTVMLDKLKADRLEKKVQLVAVPFNRQMDRLKNWYTRVLRKVLRNKGKTYLAGVLLLAVSMGFLLSNGVEMLPLFDSGVTYVTFEMEPGTSIGETNETVQYIESLLKQEENVLHYDAQVGYEQGSSRMSDFGIMGTNQGMITITLNTRKERSETIWEFQERLRFEISKISGIQRFVVKEHGGTAVGTSSAPIDLRVSGPDQEIAFMLASQLEDKIRQVEGTTNLYLSLHMNNQQMNITTDHQRLQELGLTNAVLSAQIYQAMEGVVTTTMNVGEVTGLDVSVGVHQQETPNLEDLLATQISTATGLQVPLREVADIELTDRANLITRENLEYTVNVLGYTHSRAFSHIVRDINGIIGSHPMPEGYRAGMTGEQEALTEAMGDMLFLMALAIVFVYLLLVPQFKSFLHPITIMAVIPLVMIGVAPALGLTNKYMSMPVLLGLILLAGTVVNNAILLLDDTLARRKKGVMAEEAVEQAVQSRFRPIMMTALSDIAGMLPLAFQLALGSERFSPLAIAVIGGMTAATFLTMIMVPLVYVSFEKLRERSWLPWRREFL